MCLFKVSVDQNFLKQMVQFFSPCFGLGIEKGTSSVGSVADEVEGIPDNAEGGWPAIN